MAWLSALALHAYNAITDPPNLPPIFFLLKRNHSDAFENPSRDGSWLSLFEILRMEVKERTCFTIQSNADRQMETNCL